MSVFFPVIVACYLRKAGKEPFSGDTHCINSKLLVIDPAIAFTEGSVEVEEILNDGPLLRRAPLLETWGKLALGGVRRGRISSAAFLRRSPDLPRTWTEGDVASSTANHAGQG